MSRPAGWAESGPARPGVLRGGGAVGALGQRASESSSGRAGFPAEPALHPAGAGSGPVALLRCR